MQKKSYVSVIFLTLFACTENQSTTKRSAASTDIKTAEDEMSNQQNPETLGPKEEDSGPSQDQGSKEGMVSVGQNEQPKETDGQPPTFASADSSLVTQLVALDFTTRSVHLAWDETPITDALGVDVEFRIYTHNEQLSSGKAIFNQATPALEWSPLADAITLEDLETDSPVHFYMLVRDTNNQVALTGQTVVTFDSFCGGSGTAEDPFKICTLNNLNSIRDNLAASYILQNSIEAQPTIEWNLGKGFRPIGSTSEPFSGSLNGAGYEIRDLFISRPEMDAVGLFGSISTGSIRALGIRDAQITGFNQVGVLVGDSAGTLDANWSSGEVAGNASVGGLIGLSDSPVTHSFSDATVNGFSDKIGGLIGHSSSSIYLSFATGNVKGQSLVGGLSGLINGRLTYSWASGNVLQRDSDGEGSGFGGLAGHFVAATAHSQYVWATGNVVAPGGSQVGGIYGLMTGDGTEKEDPPSSYQQGNLDFASSKGHVLGKTKVGGLIGELVDVGAVIYSTSQSRVMGEEQVGAAVGALGSLSQMKKVMAKQQENLNCANASKAVEANECLLVTSGYQKPFVPIALGAPLEFVGLKDNPIQHRKISFLDKSNYSLSGSCNQLGATIKIRGDIIFDTTCQGFDWEAELDLSALPDGPVALTIAQENSTPVGLSLTKDTDFCNLKGEQKPFSGGKGTAGEPYLICTVEQFRLLRQEPNYEFAYFRLMNSLDLARSNLPAFAVDGCQSGFCGSFDGSGFTIKNLTLNVPDGQYQALFGRVLNSEFIKNLGAENIRVIADSRVGGFSAEVPQTGFSMQNLWSTGAIILTRPAASTADSIHAGGISGQISGDASYLYSKVHILSHGHGYDVGGIFGNAVYTGSLTKAWNQGNLMGTGSVGGILGTSGFGGAVTLVKNDGDIFATYQVSGGLLGHSGNRISDSENHGSSFARFSGGTLIGSISNDGLLALNRLLSTGHSLVYDYGAGIVGRHNNGELSIQDVVHTGNLALGINAGVIVGALDEAEHLAFKQDPSLTYTNQYFLKSWSEDLPCVGLTNDYPVVSTTECTLLTDKTLFLDPEHSMYENWDFDTIWQMSAGSLPSLKWLAE